MHPNGKLTLVSGEAGTNIKSFKFANLKEKKRYQVCEIRYLFKFVLDFLQFLNGEDEFSIDFLSVLAFLGNFQLLALVGHHGCCCCWRQTESFWSVLLCLNPSTIFVRSELNWLGFWAYMSLVSHQRNDG